MISLKQSDRKSPEKSIKMAKTKDVNEKEAYSRITKNLCESQGVFLKLASEMMSLDFDDELEDDDIEDKGIPF